MKRYTLIISLLLLFTGRLLAQTSSVLFVENKQQWSSNILFRSNLHKGSLFVERNCLTYYFFDEQLSAHRHGTVEVSPEELNRQRLEFEQTGSITLPEKHSHNDTLKAHAYKVSFAGMNPRTKVYGKNPTPYTENFFNGNNPKHWAVGVQSFADVIYEDMYRNIDLHLYGNGNDFKYDFVVRPNGNPQKIRMDYSHVDAMKVRSDGVLEITTSVNSVYERKPYAFQIIEGDTMEIPCNYRLENFSVSYELGAYNLNYTLFIDPDLVFSTYNGSTSDNWGFTATYDSENNVYLGGIVEGFGYPVNLGAIQTTYGGGNWDIAIMKLDETGKNRLYATYLGGKSSEMPHSFIVNSKNELLILGTTGSPDFPVANAIQKNFAGGDSITYDNTILFENGVDMFLARISPDGSQILSSTFLGGTKNDGINFSWETDLEYGHDSLYYNYGDGARGEIMIDDDDNIYIASTTFSPDFPIFNGFQSTFGGMQDGVVCKFNPELTTLLWSSFVGGDSKDAAYSIDVDHDNNAYITGGTCSNDWTFSGESYQPSRIGGTVDAYVIQLDKTTGEQLAGSFFGSTAYDQAHFVRVNSLGNVFLFGQTTAPGSTLIFNADYSTPNSGQFLASFTGDLSKLNWSTVFGSGIGEPNLSPTAFEVDICNRIYLAGVGREWNDKPNWFNYGGGVLVYDYGWESIRGTKNMDITPDAYQKETDGKDFYIMVIDDQGSNLGYATYFGELANGYVVYTPAMDYEYYGCAASGRDHVDGGTSRFDANGYVYQSVCASCGGCNGFPIYPNPGVWSTQNNSKNCNSAVLRFRIDFGLITADFDLPEVSCASKELTFTNTTQFHYSNPQMSYLWDFGDGTTSTETSPTHTYSKEGTYTIKLFVQDFSSCNQKDSVVKELTIVTKTNQEMLETHNICLGESVLVGIPNEYNPDFQYSWSPEDWLENPSQPHTNAAPNDTTVYQLTVTQGWCKTVYEQTVNIFHNDYKINKINVFKNGVPQQPNVCKGDRVTLTVDASAPSQRYLWSLDKNFTTIINPDFSLNELTVSPTETTTYYVKTLSTYCAFEATDQITFNVGYAKIDASGEAHICLGEATPLEVENVSSERELQYNWTPQNLVIQGVTEQNAIVKPTQTTNFIVFASDEFGCTDTDTVLVKVDDLTLSVDDFTQISCFGKNDASIEVSAIGLPPYQFSWSDNADYSQPFRSGLLAGEYMVSVTDSLGCVSHRNFEVIEPSLLQIDSVQKANETCKNACNGWAKMFVSGGTKPYKFMWNNGKSGDLIRNLCNGSYYGFVTDSHGCTDTIREKVQIILDERLPQLNAHADKQTIFLGEQTAIYATETPSDTISYVWSPAIWLENPNKAITSAQPDIVLDLLFTVVASDKYGCSSYDTLRLRSVEWLCDNPYIFVPTAFTPNADGKNDLIQVQSGVISQMEFAIFDRWGEKVFETNNQADSWDGTYHGKPLQPQVFVYYLKATCLNGEEYEGKGNITLIR